MCYLATDGEENTVFVKALDFSAALVAGDAARAIQEMSGAYNFERDLLDECGEWRLSRLVRALSDGKIEDSNRPFPVQYLVFEHAETPCEKRRRERRPDVLV